MTTPLASVAVPRRPSRAVGSRVARAALALVSIATLVGFYGTVRSYEAELAGAWIGPVLGLKALPWGDAFVLPLSPTQHVAFRITDECSIVLLLVPVFAIGAAIALATRVSARRWFLALGLAGAALVVVNQVRLLLVAASTIEWGLDLGYEIAHVFVGSALAIVGFVGVLLLTVRVMFGRRYLDRRRRR